MLILRLFSLLFCTVYCSENRLQLYIPSYGVCFIIMQHTKIKIKPEDHWSCIAHLSAEAMLKSVVTEEKKFINIESEWFRPRSINDLDLWYS